MNKDNDNELLPQVDGNGNVIGCVKRGKAHDGRKALHPVVHLHLFNLAGELYLQLRPAWKSIQPNKWDTACGGHIGYGESVDEALRREVEEELGINNFTEEPLVSYIFENDIEAEYVHVFRAVYDGEVKPSDELAGGRFFTKQELAAQIGTGIFTPNFESEYLTYVQDL